MRPRRKPPLVALLTDYGTTDHYVGVLKSVIWSAVPAAQIVDITHEIEPGRIRQGAYALWASAPSLPLGSVVAAVVDPGVGSDRSIVILKGGGITWVAPDNGLLDMVRADLRNPKAYRITPERSAGVAAKRPSRTFHGRDIIAPVVAQLAKGSLPSRFGRSVTLPPPGPWKAEPTSDGVAPVILSIDRFGNIVTNIFLPPNRPVRESVRMVTVGNVMISIAVSHFAEAPNDTPCLLIGSSGLLEIVIKNGSAASILHAHDRAPLRVLWA